MVSAAAQWTLQGDYFENCNCDVVCPCEVAPGGPMTSLPTQGYCDVGLAFHVDRGSYGGVSIDGLNVVGVAHTPGAMGAGNWKMALYIDERANESQREALQAIFSGGAGGPMANFAPLIGEILGVKFVPISFTVEGKRRAVRIPQIMQMAVQAVPSMKPDGSEVWIDFGHPFAANSQLAQAAGEQGSTWADYGMKFDNAGKNGHYARIEWSGP